MKTLLPLIFIALSIALFIMYIDPTYKEVKVLRTEKESYDSVLRNATELRKKRDELRNRYNQFTPEEKEKLAKFLPDTVDNVRLILDMDNIAREKNIILNGITVNQGEATNQGDTSVLVRSGRAFGEIGVSFSFESTYAQFKDYMMALEDSLRLVDIQSLDITSSGGTGSGATGTSTASNDDLYNFSIDLKTYWLR